MNVFDFLYYYFITSIILNILYIFYVLISGKKIEIGISSTLFSIMVSIILLFNLQNQDVTIKTHYKIKPKIEEIYYKIEDGKFYKDTVYHYKPKIR